MRGDPLVFEGGGVMGRGDDISRIVTVPFTEDFIERMAADIDERFLRAGGDPRRLGVVFGGKRPALFFRRALARKTGRTTAAPRCWTIDAFTAEVVRRRESFRRIAEMDRCYLMHTLVRREAPRILGERTSFARFLPWIREILAFIDRLDRDAVPDGALQAVEANARIGYAVPEDVNRLLEDIGRLRRAYHAWMRAHRLYSPSFQYLRAAELVDEVDFSDCDLVYFGNFFSLHRCEEEILRSFHDRGRAVLVFQGDERRWSVLRRTARVFGARIEEGPEPLRPRFRLHLYSAADVHVEAATVREILRRCPDPSRTVIVLPDPETLVPLLSEIGGITEDFNVSMGYPLRRSSLHALLETIFAAQISRRGGRYYARDGLKVLRHPLVKNLFFGGDPTVTRVLVHKIEDAFAGRIQGPVSGSLFFGLGDLRATTDILREAAATLERVGLTRTIEDLSGVLDRMLDLVFTRWERIGTFAAFAGVIEGFLETLAAESPVERYPLNVRIGGRLLEIAAEMRAVDCGGEAFTFPEIVNVFLERIRGELIAFSGSPLKGLQILGLYETRALSFQEVIVLDANEGVFPRLDVYEPLIPREVTVGLGLDRLEREEETQRYQFMRLISGARSVHLVYQEGRDKERSRFVEELVWEAEKDSCGRETPGVIRPAFRVAAAPAVRRVVKTPEMVAFLRGMRYSATSLDIYLRSPLTFHTVYGLGLRPPEDLLEEPEARRVGILFHEVLEKVVRPWTGRRPAWDARARGRAMRILEERFRETLERRLGAEAFLLRAVMTARLEQFLDSEALWGPIPVEEVLSVERSFSLSLPLSCGPVDFVCRFDRLDRLADGTIVAVDYKTGNTDLFPRGWERLTGERIPRETLAGCLRSFQIPLYYLCLTRHFPDRPVNVVLCDLRAARRTVFPSGKAAPSREEVLRIFEHAIDSLVSEILDPSVPFMEGPPP